MTEAAVHNESIACVADLGLSDDGLIVAFASLEGDMVDQHFGSAQGFFVWQVTADNAEFVTSKAFGVEKRDGNEDKLKPKLAWLAGADIVYCGSVGGSATRQLLALGVHPLKVGGGPDVDELIESLQAQLQGEREFWLEKLLRQKQQPTADDRFAAMDEEGWDD